MIRALRTHDVALRKVGVTYEGLILKRGKVNPRSFARDWDAAHYRRISRYMWLLFKNYVLRRTVRTTQAFWVIDNLSPRSYFHWMTECLPRLLAAEQIGVTAPLLLPSYYREEPFVPFTLQAFPHVSVVAWLDKHTTVRVDELICPPRLRAAGDYPSELSEVSTRVAARADGCGPGRVYISRAGAGRRRIANEGEVMDSLRALGFESAHIDPANPAEQIRMARSADILVGLHGAELTNIMFMRPGTRVLELRHGNDAQFFDCYSALAKTRGVKYQALICEVAPGQRELWDSHAVNHANLVVDVPALRAMLTS